MNDDLAQGIGCFLVLLGFTIFVIALGWIGAGFPGL